jgi:hypothetical protein
LPTVLTGETSAADGIIVQRMIAALSLSAWRARGRRQFWAVLAALAVGLHVLLMAAHQPPAAAQLAVFDDPHALCLSNADGTPVQNDPGTPQHPEAPFCPICQTLHAAAPPAQAPLLAAAPWAVLHRVDPPAFAAAAPRLVLTDLNPRGPPVLG